MYTGKCVRAYQESKGCQFNSKMRFFTPNSVWTKPYLYLRHLYSAAVWISPLWLDAILWAARELRNRRREQGHFPTFWEIIWSLYKAHDLPSLFLLHKFLMLTDSLLIMRNIAALWKSERISASHHLNNWCAQETYSNPLGKKQRHLKNHVQIQLEHIATVFGTINGPFS